MWCHSQYLDSLSGLCSILVCIFVILLLCVLLFRVYIVCPLSVLLPVLANKDVHIVRTLNNASSSFNSQTAFVRVCLREQLAYRAGNRSAILLSVIWMGHREAISPATLISRRIADGWLKAWQDAIFQTSPWSLYGPPTLHDTPVALRCSAHRDTQFISTPRRRQYTPFRRALPFVYPSLFYRSNPLTALSPTTDHNVRCTLFTVQEESRQCVTLLLT